MKKYLIDPKRVQYRANLHCHSVLSDGKLTPEELKEAYKNEGYSILSITDHERPCNHSELTDKDFLMLTGYEAYIRPNPECKYDVFDKELHLNLFAKEPDNEAYICYNPKYCKYIKDEAEKEALKKVGSMRTREYSTEYINEFTRTAVENGYLVSYNHPVWSFEPEEMILSYENIFSLEIDNYSSWLGNNLEYSGALYDKLLRMGKNWFCHSADDNHNAHPFDSVYCDSFGAYTMIMADELNYASVISAMEKGEMYASTGPRINEISYENGKVYVQCSPAQKIIVFDGSKAPLNRIAQKGENLSGGEFELKPNTKYFRVAVIDNNNKTASSRGFIRKEWEE